MASCFITKSKAAEDLAKAEDMMLSTDSEQFITDVVIQRASLFPICRLLSEEALTLLPFAFYRNAHARHILDMEGGYNMLNSIKTGVLIGHINSAELNLWFARWIINVSGLDGHVNMQGSVYLTQPIADCLIALKTELDQLLDNPDYPVIDNYLAFRQQQLRVNSPYLAYLAALMRQYTPDIATEIQSWFDELSFETKEAKQKAFYQQLQTTKVTSTYKPIVFANLRDLGCSISQALTLFSHIELSAINQYKSALEAGTIRENTPLCFRAVAFKEHLKPILDAYSLDGTLPDITINSEALLEATLPVVEQRLSYGLS